MVLYGPKRLRKGEEDPICWKFPPGTDQLRGMRFLCFFFGWICGDEFVESSKIIHPPKKWRVVERSFWMFFFFQFVPRKKNVETACCMNILVDLVDWANIYIRNEEV